MAEELIGAGYCPICLREGRTCKLDGLIGCVEECPRCEAEVERRAHSMTSLIRGDKSEEGTD